MKIRLCECCQVFRPVDGGWLFVSLGTYDGEMAVTISAKEPPDSVATCGQGCAIKMASRSMVEVTV